MPKWEYKLVNMDSTTVNRETLFNELGQMGWELVALAAPGLPGGHEFGTAIMKRPVE